MIKKILISLFLVNILLLILFRFVFVDQGLKIYFFDVGQGDAAYIRTPAGQDILIDGGPSDRILSKLGEAMPFYDRTIDIVILTHPHSDHVMGLLSVLKHYQVNQVYLTGALHSSYEYLEFLELLAQDKKIKKIKIDHQFSLDLLEDLKLEFLYPDFDVADDTEHQFIQDNLNNTSVVNQLVYKDKKILFTGDIEQRVEKYLLDKNIIKDTVNILKVAHHGADTSSTKEFLAKTSPDLAVISVGAENRFGHPAKLVLESLKNQKITIKRTDQDSNVVIRW